MPKYRYIYFPIKALGEGPRLLLAYGGEDFEDKRMSFEEWPKHKHETLFNQLPELEFDGKKYGQSIAICRYLGQKYGLAGSTPEEDLEIEQIALFLDDLRTLAAKVHYEDDKNVKAKKHAEYSAEKYPFMLKKVNEFISNNNGYLALGKLTWVDFMFAGLYDYIKEMIQRPDLDTQYPAFKNLKDKVLSLPRVKEYNAAAYPA